jgi:hypothetical protein
MPLSWFRSWLKVFLPLVLVFGWSADAHAYAWMIRHGYAKCTSCHTDPSGGETLTHMGRVESETLLSQPWGDGKVSNTAKYLFGVTEPDWLRAGGSLRGMLVKGEGAAKVFPMQLDAYATADFGIIQAGASLGYSKVLNDSPFAHAAQITSAKSDDPKVGASNLVSRWHWLGVELGDHTLARVGRLNLPFGVRVSEHTLWARNKTRTDRESNQSHGVSFAQNLESLRWEAMFILGNYQIAPDDYRERGYSLYFEYLFTPKLAIGASSMIVTSAKSISLGLQKPSVRHAHGLTGRYSPVEPVVLLAEFDVLKNSRAGLGYTGFAILDIEPLQGLHVGGTFEVLSTGKPQDGKSSLGAGKLQKGYWGTISWFFLPHMDLRVDVVFRDGVDADNKAKLNGSYQAQIHVYL